MVSGNIYVPPGVVLVSNASHGQPIRAYQSVTDPSQVWHVTNPEMIPMVAGVAPPPFAKRMIVCPDGDRWQVAVANGLYSVRHVRPEQFDREIYNSYDLGRQDGVNWRGRWIMHDKDESGSPIKVECNPMPLGGSAGTALLYPSPENFLEVTRASHIWSLYRRSQTCMDFDPRDKENGNWSRHQMVPDDDPMTQAMWTTQHFTTEDSLDVLSGVWQKIVTHRIIGGTPAGVESVLFDRLVSGHFLTDTYDGGAVWIDAGSGARVESDPSQWGADGRPEWNAVYNPKDGSTGRVDSFGSAGTLDFPFPSGKAIVLLRSGTRGVPDNRTVVGFAAKLGAPSSSGYATAVNSIKVGPGRKGTQSGSSTSPAFMRVALSAESRQGFRRGGEIVSMTFFWTHGFEDEVIQKLVRALAQ